MSALEPDQRLEELLDLEALTGLDDPERAELAALVRNLPTVALGEERFSRSRAASALYLALAARSPAQQPPQGFNERLVSRLARESQATRGPARRSAPAAGLIQPSPRRVRKPERPASEPRAEPETLTRARRSWLLPIAVGLGAAAAALFLFNLGETRDLRQQVLLERQNVAQLGQDVQTERERGGVAATALAEEQAQRQQLQGQLAEVTRERDLLRQELDALRLERATRIEDLALARGQIADLTVRLTETEERARALELRLEGPNAREEWLRLLSENGTMKASWQALGDSWTEGREISGEVVWNAAEGRGYMRFTGLPENDPGQVQYQLWIFDKTLSADTPIDGGVFDIPAGTGEQDALIAMDPKIAVQQPWRFAITLERPGGVVVSGRDHLLLLADA